VNAIPRTVTVPPWALDPLQLKYVQVADHIAARIEAGDLPGGLRLPPERDLANEYDVSYVTIRKSTGLLRERGLIITMHGRGTYIVPDDRRPQP
jgi:GntR family transcriptional regulator